MHRLAGALLSLPLVLTTLAAPQGGSYVGIIKVNLPLAFTVLDTNFPAGSYVFEQRGRTEKMTIRSANGRVREMFGTIPLRPKKQSQSYLVFHRYGDQYFLNHLYMGNLGYEFPVSNAEKELQEGGSEAVVVKVIIKE